MGFKIGIIDQCKDVREVGENLPRIACALEHWWNADVASLWDTLPNVSIRVLDSEKDLDSDVWPFFIRHTLDVKDALADHSTTDEGTPTLEAGLDVILDNGGSIIGPNGLAAAMAHELGEAGKDPFCDVYFLILEGPHIGKMGSYEICDPCQDGSYESPIEKGVFLSNFVGPDYFSVVRGSRYDFMDKLSAPMTITAGGYMELFDGKHFTQVFGEKMPEWQRRFKSKFSRHARHRRRIQHVLANLAPEAVKEESAIKVESAPTVPQGIAQRIYVPQTRSPRARHEAPFKITKRG